MSKFSQKVKTLFRTKYLLQKKIVHSPFIKLFPDRWALKIIYKSIFEKKLNLKQPKTFNEKLQWLKLYNRKPEYTIMVDKYAAKKYVADIIGEEHIIPTLGVWEKFDDIDFEKLPEQFVLKVTHGSGDIVICRDIANFDKKKAKEKLTRALKTDYYKISREWPYKKVPRRIIAETYMEDESGSLNDYKFFCFNGKVKCSFVAIDRFDSGKTTMTHFDREWNVLPFSRGGYPYKVDGLQKPKNYEEMLSYAERLSTNIPFLRVDFYNINGKVYFGELTFFPGGGYKKLTPNVWDYRLGEWLKLPKN